MEFVRKRSEILERSGESFWLEKFAKSFSKKSDAVIWIKELEHKLRSAPLPDVEVTGSKVTLKNFFSNIPEEISPLIKDVSLKSVV